MKSNKLKKNIRVNDQVVVISGRDKGKSGAIKKVDRTNLIAIVSDIALNKKHVKRDSSSQDNVGIIEKEAWVSLSKLRKQ
ncbi:50S ribosomal protein L24 [Chloracidobacterium validum]|uniref:Large ribosomal subunit protein uL24 n=1 Tax=Chloracidobacterium validum TaxID=2821543 RepID=A0ABX8B9X9_9BACT|nr:50S ribosomal protein L24 [Chloracidobacterium validum]QUW03481.1 50S ribosomal protein L24 [Chloracidobacterium validum]